MCVRYPRNAERRSRAVSTLAVAALLQASSAAGAEQVSANFADLTLEQLANIQVTSVSKRAERLADSAGSVYVITADDIRRSGATTLPEVLRLAPNLQVARADAAQYAITARGYNSTLANKMLVMIDGRTVYSPLFSGVFWEAQDTLLEDIERIEVISGPGGTLWGSNAVNGVINITTRTAGDTQGALAAAGAGNRHRGAAFRYGGELGAGGSFRVYGKLGDESQSRRANGTGVGDGWDRKQVGFRADWGGLDNRFTLQGDAYAADIDQLPATRKLTGYNLLGRWSRTSGDSDMRLQAYYDRVERDQPGAIREVLDTVDVDFQHGFRLGESQRILWGGGYRYAPDRVVNLTPVLAFVPGNRTQKRGNVFVQDEIALRPGLDFTIGAKLETNEYTGLEFLPSARLAWKPREGHLLWASLSRAVRAPSRIDREIFIPAGPPFLIAGGPDFRSEVAKVAELGYKAQLFSNFSLSVTGYHRRFEHLRSTEPSPAGPVFGNKIQARTTGLETWGTLSLAKWWRLQAGLTGGSVDVGGLAAQGNDPKHWWVARSSWDLGTRHELDLMVRHVGALPNPSVPAYTAVDARFGWRALPGLEFSLTGQNLFDRRHPEWGAAPGRPEFERSVFAKVLWRL
jgi:iron complex outermembrane receptor protein